mgnify:CR=1 FL=1
MQKILDAKKKVILKRPSIMLSHEHNTNNWDNDSLVI